MSQPSVQLFDGAEIWQVPTISPHDTLHANTTSVIVCGETRPFRFLARQLKFVGVQDKELDVLELGCSTGETTLSLTKRFRKVVGVDISAEVIAMPAGPGLDLRLLDVLADLELLNQLIVDEFSPTELCFFIDIGGDRLQDTVLLLLEHVMQQFKPMFIVLKCRKLYRSLLQVPLPELDSQWKAHYQQAITNTREERMRLHPKRFGLAIVPGSIPEQAICRYFNYKSCTKADECPHDHTHCHFCKRLGHRAKDCELFATELLFVRKG